MAVPVLNGFDDLRAHELSAIGDHRHAHGGDLQQGSPRPPDHQRRVMGRPCPNVRAVNKTRDFTGQGDPAPFAKPQSSAHTQNLSSPNIEPFAEPIFDVFMRMSWTFICPYPW